jgi:hypothetical protein
VGKILETTLEAPVAGGFAKQSRFKMRVVVPTHQPQEVRGIIDASWHQCLNACLNSHGGARRHGCSGDMRVTEGAQPADGWE